MVGLVRDMVISRLRGRVAQGDGCWGLVLKIGKNCEDDEDLCHVL